MHRSRLAAAVALLTLAMLCPPAFGQGNVLVPPDDDSPITQAPEQPPAKSESSEPTIALPTLDSGASQAPAAAPNNDRTPTAPPPDVKIVNVPMPVPESVPDDTGFTRSLAIAVAPTSHWSPQDATTVQSAIGLAPADMPQHCRLSAAGLARSNIKNGIYSFDLGLTPITLMPYDGQLTDISLRLHALCDPVPLPATTHYIAQVGDKYSVLLPSIPCDPPPNGARQLLIEYSGNGNGRCLYQ